ncbi:death-associated inhibitor of apoptosis 1-like [Microplitis demolitor]|uniref:death-associated inhibitor of apoptosis 1-like n=1 Tax=Microplitis demolitor TaxID=69319 RepID=UPI0004CD7BFA|nr:death-associated inhibitor of apoptosis 1-like [Microplitis demolitor]
MTSMGEHGTTSPDYRFEGARLRSFTNWPLARPQPRRLAAAGFYYTGVIDSVKCFFCGVEICMWEEDDPVSEHQRWRGSCRFIHNLPSGNIPLDEDFLNMTGPSEDTVNIRTTRESPVVNYVFASTSGLNRTGLTRHTQMAHPNYSLYQTRLESFKKWSPLMPQTKERLAEAGFFYTGTGDQTLCYHCGGGLKDWEPEDDPWVQHAKWFKNCYYVRLTRGQSFIDSVVGIPVAAPVLGELTSINLPSCLSLVAPVWLPESSNQGAEEGKEQNGSAEEKEDTKVKEEKGHMGDEEEEKRRRKEESRDARVCKICYDEELGVIFLPCGHVVACFKCASAITTCAVCREPITLTARAILA